MDPEPLRVRPSLLPMAAQCRLRFQREVRGGVGMVRFSRANADRAFLVRNLLVDAIEQAHAAGPEGMDLLLHTEPPEGLLAEERWLFRRGLDHYVELVGERGGAVLQPDERYPVLPHSSGRFVLSLRLELCFTVEDGGAELRRIGFGPPREDPGQDPRVLAVAVLLAHRGHAFVRVAHLDLLHGRMKESLLDRPRIAEAARDIGEIVLTALDDPRPEPAPGWWCHECPALRSCPAVSQQAPSELVLMATGEAMGEV